jgi:site-specific DNA-methyltransferase (adenine-specific)
MSKTKLMLGDNIESLKKLPDNSVDSIVTDPPYALTSIRKRFGKEGSAPAQYGTDGAFQRASKGFMGKEWDAEVPTVEFWREVYRVLKPGGHILSFGGTRTYHRMVVNIEDAGFEIRDQIMWLYGSGFPKSHNIQKTILKDLEKELKVKHDIKEVIWK